VSKKLKWGVSVIAALLALMLGYIAAGPYLAINGIHNVVASGQYGELWRFIDFDQLRSSLRPQIQERIARGIMGHTGTSQGAKAIGEVTAMIADPAIDAMVSPQGIATLLEGSAFGNRVRGIVNEQGQAQATDPLKGAATHFESPSLFTATAANAEGKPVVFEFRRSGLTWKLAGLRLPEN
jgi:hypothetical protein